MVVQVAFELKAVQDIRKKETDALQNQIEENDDNGKKQHE